MAVLIEAWSVLVRRDAIEQRIEGGWSNFLSLIPNRTLCTDGKLARVGFMSWDDAEEFVQRVADAGLDASNESQWLDLTIVNQLEGPTGPTPWLRTSHVNLAPDQKILVGWISSRPVPDGVMTVPTDVAVPDGWTYETSITANMTYVPSLNPEEYKFLRTQDGLDVYLEIATGKEMYVGRT